MNRIISIFHQSRLFKNYDKLINFFYQVLINSRAYQFKRANIQNSPFYKSSIVMISLRNSSLVQSVAKFLQYLFRTETLLQIIIFYLVLIPIQFLPSVEIFFLNIPIFRIIPLSIVAIIYFKAFFNITNSISVFKKFLIVWCIWLIFNIISSLQTPPHFSSIVKLFYFEYTSVLLLFSVFFIGLSQEKILKIWKSFIFAILFLVLYSFYINIFGELKFFLGIFKTDDQLVVTMNQKIELLQSQFTPSSAFGNAGMRGSLIACAFCSGIFYLINFFHQLRRSTKILYSIIFILFLIELFLCSLKGAWISVVLTLCIVCYYQYKSFLVVSYRKSKKLIFIPFSIILLLIVFWVTFSKSFDVKHRKLQLQIAARIFMKNFLFGIGTNNYSAYADQYKGEYKKLSADFNNNSQATGLQYNIADNYWVTFIVEKGVIGVGFFLIVLVYLIKKIIRYEQNYDPLFNVILSIPISIIILCLFWDVVNHLTFRIIFSLFTGIIIFEIIKQK